MRDIKIRTAVASAMIAMMLLFSLFGVAITADPTAQASRTIDPKTVQPGQEVGITVVFQNLAGQPKAFALQEDFPDGWGFDRGTDDASVFKAGPPPEWLWFVVDTGANKTVTYTLTVPVDAESGNYTIEGRVIDAENVTNIVGGDTTITVSVETLYVLTMAANPGAGGTATDLTNASPYAEGAAVSIKAQAAASYRFVNWTAGAGAFGNVTAAETIFTMPAQNATVTANFQPLPSQVPTVTTQAATGIATGSAALHAYYTVGTFSPVKLCIAYKKSTDSVWIAPTIWMSRTTDGTYDQLTTGLTPGTTYDFKARLDYNGTIIEGAILQFTTGTLPGIGCFIATAAYGTPTAKQIDVLREFRDVVLLKSTLGSRFVSLYYQLSPPIADFIAGHELVRTLVRELLIDPIVWLIDTTGNSWRN